MRLPAKLAVQVRGSIVDDECVQLSREIVQNAVFYHLSLEWTITGETTSKEDAHLSDLLNSSG